MVVLLLVFLAAVPACPLRLPVDGPVVGSFAPRGDYGGHWGIDLAAVPGSPVTAAASGTVTFSGRIAGRLSVTVHHGGGVRTSYSYLSTTVVAPNVRVGAGEQLGTSGLDRGVAAVHYSVRIGDRYVSPPLADCRLIPTRGVRLRSVIGASSYPLRRATRNPRWHLRPSPPRPSDGR